MKKFTLVLCIAIATIFASLYSVKAKKTSAKKNYKKVYNFSIQGDCTNADADIVWDSEDSDEHSLFRKISVPGIKTSNMPQFELLRKYTPYSGFSGEMWQPFLGNNYYLTDGYIWIRYTGYDEDNPNDGCSESRNLGDFKLFIY